MSENINFDGRSKKKDVKIEQEMDDNEVESETLDLYANHVIKDEMVIGPELFLHSVYNIIGSQGPPRSERPIEKQDKKKYLEETTKNETEAWITQNVEKATSADVETKEKIKRVTRNSINFNPQVLLEDVLQTKLARLQKQDKNKDQIVTIETAERITPPTVDEVASTDITPKEEEQIKKLTGRSTRINYNRQIVKDKNINPMAFYNVFTCNDCGKHFDRKSKLERHIQHHEKIKNKVYLKCKQCSYQTVTRGSLQRHKKLHDKKRSFVCDECGYRFKNTIQLQIHSKTGHYGEKRHKCGICDYRFLNVTNLKNHLRIHSDEKPFACLFCDFRCKHKKYLKLHLRIHTGESPYSCSMCDYKCKHKNYLKQHLRIHTGEKPFSCSMCDYKCRQINYVKRHLRIHTGEKPFSCSICEFKCSTRRILKNHMKRHTDENPHLCDMCDYKTFEIHDLKKHLRIHSAVKPYSCSLCPYKCVRKTRLRDHLMTHRGEKPYSCHFCAYKAITKSTLQNHLKNHTN